MYLLINLCITLSKQHSMCYQGVIITVCYLGLLWFLLVLSIYFILLALCIPLLEEKQEKYTKPSTIRSHLHRQARVEKSPIPSSSTTKQSSTISDHTSATGDSGLLSHGLGEGSDIM